MMSVMQAHPIAEQAAIQPQEMSGRPAPAAKSAAPIAEGVIDRNWCIEMLEARVRKFERQKLFHIARALSSVAAEISSY